MRKRGNVILILVIFFLALLFFFLVDRGVVDNDSFQIYFFQAGKADAILLRKEDSTIMIDTGEESLSEEILSYFSKNNITKLDALIITHFDKDHVGSASSILDSLEVSLVYQTNVVKDSIYYERYIESLEKKEITPITVSGDLEVRFGDIEVVINGPDVIYDSNESNNSSLIVSVVYGKNKFLFMGDSQNARIHDYLRTHSEVYDFLKVPYHGNYLKRLESVLETTKVQYAVITSSSEEMEDERVLELLEKYQVKKYLTREGSILLLSDGENIQVKQ